MTAVSPMLDARFRAAAAATGLLDAAFDVVGDTPIGDLVVGVTDHGICRVHFDADPERTLEVLARQYGPRVLRSSKPVDRARKELDEYFAGRRHAFDLDWDVRQLAPFNRRVLSELARVEYGQTTTYGQLAAASGNPKAARAVGTIMNRNPIPVVLPCHRVVGADGKLVGYAGGLERKALLLRLEGAID